MCVAFGAACMLQLSLRVYHNVRAAPRPPAGVPDEDTPTVGMDLDEGMVVGIDINRTSSSGSAAAFGYVPAASAGASAGRAGQPVASSAAANEVERLDDLAESLRTSAIEDKTYLYLPFTPKSADHVLVLTWLLVVCMSMWIDVEVTYMQQHAAFGAQCLESLHTGGHTQELCAVLCRASTLTAYSL